jgi:hypothetical protein
MGKFAENDGSKHQEKQHLAEYWCDLTGHLRATYRQQAINTRSATGGFASRESRLDGLHHISDADI